ncbi:GPI ethanolamine phosphate transferase 3 [Plasmodium brasilianum]|uniref:GPI ethanolamine phosphate transferase 3 n=1 Tax=Plasmodium brasilianum TaxID=5824 RepID=A0ACB9Y195_PLABR|nr:GPI ethanolamine phosphate transferase 3 [Plasmodium brasilianum]
MKEKSKYHLFGNFLTNHLLIFFMILLINVLLYFSFINGFLFPREGIVNKSENLEIFSRKVFGDEYIEFLKKKKHVHSIINAPYNRIIILLIDSLRFDFALYDPNYSKEKEKDETLSGQEKQKDEVKYFLNNMLNLHNILKNEKKNSRLFRFEADAPTVTTSRLKSMLIGTIPNYMDLNENFSPNENIQDNFVEQLHSNKKTIIAIGDETITKLTRNITKKLVYESFNMFDLYSLDIKSKNHFYKEYSLSYWDIIYVHMLGVDHVGHVKKTNSKIMKNVIKNFDILIHDIIKKIKLEQKHKTLFVVFGDHGQMDSGDHGGFSADEIDSALFVYSPLGFMNMDKNIDSKNLVLYDREILHRSSSPSDASLGPDNNTRGKESYIRHHSVLRNAHRDKSYFYNVKHTKQINLISTLSFLIGSTVPFCNIGNVILDILPSAYKTNTIINIGEKDNKKKNTQRYNKNQSNIYYDLLDLHYIAELNYANLWQINRYLNEYEKNYTVDKNENYFLIKNGWKQIEEKKSCFFKPDKEFIDNEEMLNIEKESYIEYINKMRNLMQITQKYFYFIFSIKKKSFIILSFAICIFYFLILKLFYHYSKLNYYHKSITASSLIFILIFLFIIVITFDFFNGNIYIMLLPFVFLFFLVFHIFSKNKYKDISRFFIYSKLSLISNLFLDEDLITFKGIQHQESDYFHNYNNRKDIYQKGSNKKFFQKFFGLLKCLLIIIKRSASKSASIVFPNIFHKICCFISIEKKSIQIIKNNKFFIFVIVWSLFLMSFNYIYSENHFIHLILIVHVLSSTRTCERYLSYQFFRELLLLAALIINMSVSFLPSYFVHDKEKLFLKRSVLNIALPITFYFFSILLINCNIHKLLRKKIKTTMIVGWTIQFILVVLFLQKINDHLIFWFPPIIYILTFSLIAFVLLRKNSIIEKEKIEDSYQKIYEVSISFFLILMSALQLSLIIYSNTNLSVMVFFYMTLLFFYFYFISMNNSRKNQDINNVKLMWIRENRNIDMFINSKEEIYIKEKFTVNTSVKEKFYLKLEEQRESILDKCNYLNHSDITQIQVYKLIRNISFFYINETDFYILSFILLKYSFFLTGQKFVFTNLPLISAYIGFNKYVWPLISKMSDASTKLNAQLDELSLDTLHMHTGNTYEHGLLLALCKVRYVSVGRFLFGFSHYGKNITKKNWNNNKKKC